MGRKKDKEASDKEVIEEHHDGEEMKEVPGEEPHDTTGSEEDPQDVSYGELHEKYLRLYSEFDNFRKRSIKEKADIIKSAGGDVMGSLLPVLDDFERAIASNENVEDLDALKEGFKLIHHKMVMIMEGKGLKAMDSKGKDFDVDHHEAITQMPIEDESQKGKVLEVVEPGYFLNDTVLRYAKVVVGS